MGQMKKKKMGRYEYHRIEVCMPITKTGISTDLHKKDFIAITLKWRKTTTGIKRKSMGFVNVCIVKRNVSTKI